MNRRAIGLALIGATVVAVGVLALRSGPTTSSQSQSQQPPTAPTGQVETSKVEIKGFAFSPASIKVKKGTTVTWTNTDTASHNVVAQEGAPAGGPNGPLFGQNQTFSHTFDSVGVYAYICTPHPFMKGTVEVTE